MQSENRAILVGNLGKDPEVRRKLTPDTPWGCMRPLFSNDYYPTFNRPNVSLVTDGITRITPTGIVMAADSRTVIQTTAVRQLPGGGNETMHTPLVLSDASYKLFALSAIRWPVLPRRTRRRQPLQEPQKETRGRARLAQR